MTYYRAVMKVILLFGLEMWVMYLYMRSNLGGFHHRVIF